VRAGREARAGHSGFTQGRIKPPDIPEPFVGPSAPFSFVTFMEIHNAQFTGAVFAAVASLLGAYALTLRIREALAEKPDPKLTYATKTEFERMRGTLESMQRDWNAAKTEMTARSDGALASVHELIRRNAEHIAVLIAQTEMFDRRITETAQRVDRLGERIGR
jgi:hypothetical protein